MHVYYPRTDESEAGNSQASLGYRAKLYLIKPVPQQRIPPKQKQQLWFRGHTACTKDQKPAVLARLQPFPITVPLILYPSIGGQKGVEAQVVGCFISFFWKVLHQEPLTLGIWPNTGRFDFCLCK